MPERQWLESSEKRKLWDRDLLLQDLGEGLEFYPHLSLS